MMILSKYYSLPIILLSFLSLNGQALFVNDNAVITIENSAVLYVDGDLQNINSGTIANNGTIDVVGDFENAATYTSGSGSILRLSGDQNSGITSGSATIANIEANKDAGSFISLNDDLTVSEGVEFITSDNRILCNGNALALLPGAIFNSVSPTNYVVTGLANSKVIRKNLAAGEQFHFPVGADNTSFNPVDVTAVAGHTTDDLNVYCYEEVLTDGTSGSPITEDVVDVSWEIDEATSGGANINIALHWKDGVGTGDELTGFDASNCGVSKHDGTSWDLFHHQLSNAVASGYTGYSNISRDEITDFSTFAVGWESVAKIRAFPKLLLEGPYNSGTGDMDTLLNYNHLLPGQDKDLSPGISVQLFASHTPFGQPYNTAPWNYNGNSGAAYGDPSSPGAPAITIPYPTDVVDWILVTIREGGTLPANNIWRCAGWLKKDGEIVFPEDCGLLDIDPLLDYHFIVEHRNHLGALSPLAVNNDNATLKWDFTSSNSWIPGSWRVGQKEMSSGIWALYASNGEQIIGNSAINSGDQTSWKDDQNGINYLMGDFNMNVVANSADETVWKTNQNSTSGVVFY